MLDRFRHFVEYDFTGSDQPWSVAAILKRSPPRFQALNGTPLLPRWKNPRDLGEVGDFRSLPMCSWENLWKAFHTRSWVAILTLKSRVLWRDGMSEAVDSLIPTTGALLPPHLMGQVRSLRHLVWSLWITSGSISSRVVVMVALRVLEPLCFLRVRIWEDYWLLVSTSALNLFVLSIAMPGERLFPEWRPQPSQVTVKAMNSSGFGALVASKSNPTTAEAKELSPYQGPGIIVTGNNTLIFSWMGARWFHSFVAEKT